VIDATKNAHEHFQPLRGLFCAAAKAAADVAENTEEADE